MPVPTDDSRRGGLPGTPPRFVVVLASAGLVALTGAAVWLLPAEAGPPGGLAAGSTAPAVGSATELAGMERQRRLVVLPPERRPSGYVTYVHTASEPRFSPAAEMRRTGVRWYALGHLTAGPDGCTPKWGGTTDQGRDPVANRLARLRAAGGDVSLLFGGGGGRELAETCADTRALTAAYRRVIGAFDPPHIDFELAAPPASVPLPAGSGGAATGPGQGDPRPMGTALPLPPQGAAAAQREPASAVRRARALRALKRQAMSEGRSLDVGFTVPAGASGLAEGHRAVLRATRGAGGPVDTVTLLVPLRRTPTPASCAAWPSRCASRAPRSPPTWACRRSTRHGGSRSRRCWPGRAT
ncbi:glycoside hydrolase family 18 protein [Thermocatellispora tengchongensis]|uniref:hypothetical protein n=1 Tax=Thermocatellispora tengchongensis TaxID=1073253 RepID=UPI003639C18A